MNPGVVPLTDRDPGDETEYRFLIDESELRRRLDAARKEGYAAGYEDGYEDGSRRGVRDGYFTVT